MLTQAYRRQLEKDNPFYLTHAFPFEKQMRSSPNTCSHGNISCDDYCDCSICKDNAWQARAQARIEDKKASLQKSSLLQCMPCFRKGLGQSQELAKNHSDHDAARSSAVGDSPSRPPNPSPKPIPKRKPRPSSLKGRWRKHTPPDPYPVHAAPVDASPDVLSDISSESHN